MAPTLAQIQFGDIAGTVGKRRRDGPDHGDRRFNALSPLTTEGDLPYYHAASNARLAVGSSGQCLTSNGTDPLWGSCATSFTGDGTFATNSGSTGAVTLALGNAGANKWWGNNTGSSAAPGYQSIGTQDTSPNWYAAGGGTAQAQTVTLSPAPTALTPGLVVVWKPAAANTAAAPTLAVNGLTAKPITKCGTAALLASDLSTAELEIAVYDGTEFQLLNPVTGLCSTSNTAGGIYYSGGSGAAPKAVRARQYKPDSVERRKRQSHLVRLPRRADLQRRDLQQCDRRPAVGAPHQRGAYRSLPDGDECAGWRTPVCTLERCSVSGEYSWRLRQLGHGLRQDLLDPSG